MGARAALPRLAVAAVAAGLCACGGGGGERASDPLPPRASPVVGAALSRADLRRELGNAFHTGLYRLAVMAQPPEGAVDLGQDLPTGLVDRVVCTTGARCAVRWETVNGRPRVTRFAVAVHDGCFSARAQPQARAVYDATLGTVSVHPLNDLVATSARCTGGAPAAPATPAGRQLPGSDGALSYESRDPVSGFVPTATAAEFRAPLRAYRRYVRAELKAMLDDVTRLRDSISAGDLPRARGAWLAADERYESIGAAYGAFGALDRRVNGRPAGLAGRARSSRFAGLHRVELALWGRSSTADATAPAARLQHDVFRMRAVLRHTRIDELEYSLRAHEILEDTLHLQLTGRASPWSGAALQAVRGNVRGTRVVLTTIAAMVDRRDPRVLPRARHALAELDAAVARHAGPGGRLPRWDAVSRRARAEIAGLTAGAAERLAFVPELIDPRPPRAPLRVVETP